MDLAMPLSDDFSGSTLDGRWTTTAPAGSSVGFGSDASDAFLTLTTPDGTFDAWQDSNTTARIMQASPDTDFTLETRFLSTPTEGHQIQGLLVEEDADTWLRFDTHSDGNRLYAFAAYTDAGDNTVMFRVAIPGNSAPYLRVDRAGDVWTMEYSVDGATWVTAGSFTLALSVSQTGVFAGNVGQAAGFAAQVDYFATSLDPLTNEDGSFVPSAPPVAVTDSYTLGVDGDLTVDAANGLLANDSDPDAGGLSIAVLSGPANGTLSLNADGSFSYAANAGHVGDDSFTYQITDASGDTDTATVTLQGASSPPSGSAAQSDDFSGTTLDPVWLTTSQPGTSEGVAVIGADGVLELQSASGNYDVWNSISASRAMQAVADTDFQLVAGFLSVPTEKYQSQGFLIIADDDNWIRLDTHTDGNKMYAFAASSQNGTPSAEFQVEIADEQSAFLRMTRTGDTWQFETSADGVSWTVAGSFTHALTVTEAGLFAGNYNAPGGFTAVVDFFENTASPIVDEDGSVIPVNTAPVATDDTISTAADTEVVIDVAADLLANDTDADGDSLTLASIGTPANGSLSDNGDGTYSYTPNPGFTGTDSFEYTVSDDMDVSTATVTISVAGPQSPPESDDFSGGTLSNVWTFAEPGTGSYSFVSDSTDAYISLVATGQQDVWTTNTATRIMQASPDTDFTLETRFLSTPTEGHQIQGLLVEEDADTWLRFDTHSDGNRLYAFAAYTDAGDNTVMFRVAIPGNSAPYLRVDRAGDVWTMEYSVDGATWVTAGSFTLALSVSQTGVFAGNVGQAAGFAAQVDYFATSLDPLTNEDGSFVPSAPPVAVTDSYTLGVDGDLTVDAANGLLANDSDPDAGGLSIAVLSGPANGTLSLNADGSFSYAANAGHVGDDSFTYQITDASGDTDTATVTLQGASSPPSGSAAQSDDFSGTTLDPVWLTTSQPGTSEGVAVIGADGVLELQSASGNYDVWNSISASRAMQAVADTDFQLVAGFLSVPTEKYQSQGFLIIADDDNWIRLDTHTDGNKMYAFAASSQNGTPSAEFQVEIADEQSAFLRMTRTGDTWQFETSADGVSWTVAGSFTHALTVTEAGLFAGNYNAPGGFTAVVDFFENTASPIVDEDGSVIPVNTAPVATDDTISTAADTEVVIDVAADLLANDTDADGDSLTLASIGTPANGSLSDNGDGTYSYTPNPGFTGTDTVSYAVSDGITADAGILNIVVLPPATPAVSDDFAGGPLDEIWTFFGDGGSASVGTTETQGFVELNNPYGLETTASGTLTVPRLLQSQTDEDFQISAGFLTEPTKKYQENGMLVVQDDSNFIRFDVAYTGSGLDLIVGITENGTATFPLFKDISVGAVTDFRITRVGDDWTFETSSDGVNWTQQYTMTHQINVTQVGVFAGSTSSDGEAPGYISQVDYFENSATPISDEDGTLIPTNLAPVATDDSLAVDTDTALSIDVVLDLLSNDTDSNDDGISIDSFGQPLHGTLTDNGDGTLTYQPDAGYAGTDSFSYTISDGTLTDTANVDLFVGNPISVWYGDVQSFGGNGQAQTWINVLGNVEGSISSLSYSLNGGASRDLAVGSDGRRLHDEGDFNIDLAYSELDGSTTDDTITITAVMTSGQVFTHDVTIEYEDGQNWEQNYSIDWDSVTNIQDAVQVVDGTWSIQDGGVRPVDLGYDRLLVLGDHTWDNYEVNLTVSTHDLLNIDPSGRDGNGFAFGMLWGGHTDDPIPGFQPKAGWEPGAAFFYSDTNLDGVGRLSLHPSQDFLNDLGHTSVDLDEGVTYSVTMRVEQVGLYDRQYSLRIWEEGTTEPVGWTLQGMQTFTLDERPATGALYLNAHYLDVSFNDLSVTEIVGRDIVRGLDGDDVLIAVDPTAGAPGLGEVDVFVGDDGADTFVFGDSSGAYYDDGQIGTLGEADYGYIWDFASGTDRIELAGSASDYALAEDVAGLEAGTAIMLVSAGQSELIGIVGGVYGLDLGSDDFVYSTVIG
ncbi:Ig-like domain-containing protein [Vannielia sp. SX4]|uniref:Ig-like domain-containing protein n=1 Tax=Vannielia sp. SX4 TaxID=3463852 RepID=UPI004059A5CF